MKISLAPLVMAAAGLLLVVGQQYANSMIVAEAAPVTATQPSLPDSDDDSVPVAIIPGPAPDADRPAAATTGAPVSSADTVPTSSRVVTVAVETDWSQIQVQLDRCVGPVLSLIPGLVPYIGQHDFCGGRQLSGFSIGETVTIANAGAYSGTWRVMDISYSTVGTPFDPSHVGELVLATCIGEDDVILTALAR